MSGQFKETNNQQSSIVAEIKKAFNTNKDVTLDELAAILKGKGLSEFQPTDLSRELNKIKATNEPAKILEAKDSKTKAPDDKNNDKKISPDNLNEAKDSKTKAPDDKNNDKKISPDNLNTDASTRHRTAVAGLILKGPANSAQSVNNAGGGRSQ